MRVAHLLCKLPAPDVTEGSPLGVRHLCQAQAALGLQVALSYLAAGEAPEIPGVRVRGFPRSPLRFRVPPGLLRELADWRPDLLHLHLPYEPANVTLARWARRRGLPYVVSPHGALSPGEMRDRGALKLPYKHLFERRLLNGAACVVCSGDREAVERYGVKAPIVVVPNGFDPAEVPHSLDPEALRRRRPQLAGRRVFLFLGRLDTAQKGLDLLLDALARARLEGAALVLAGPDWRGGERRLRRRAARLGATTPVHFLGPVRGREKFECLAGADVFLHPSRWEGMPHAVLEAAAVGLPALLTRVADPLGRLSEARAALLVEPDPAAIAAGLRHLAQLDAGELQRMGERAREVSREFTWQRAATTSSEAYARHLGTRVQRGS